MLKDSRYTFWNGQYSLLTVVLGNGAFRASADYSDTTSDIFNNGAGIAKFWTVGPPINQNSQ
jgi:hypothetical protein